jgi:CcmD family protein
MCKRISLLFAAVVSLAVRLSALQPPTGQSEFVPANSLPRAEQVPAAPLLIAAYAFVWLAVMFYVWTIWKRIRKVEAEMQALARRTERR